MDHTQIEYVILKRLDGANEEVQRPALYKTLREATQRLYRMSLTAPPNNGSCHKVDVTLVFTTGEGETGEGEVRRHELNLVRDLPINLERWAAHHYPVDGKGD